MPDRKTELTRKNRRKARWAAFGLGAVALGFYALFFIIKALNA